MIVIYVYPLYYSISFLFLFNLVRICYRQMHPKMLYPFLIFSSRSITITIINLNHMSYFYDFIVRFYFGFGFIKDCIFSFRSIRHLIPLSGQICLYFYLSFFDFFILRRLPLIYLIQNIHHL